MTHSPSTTARARTRSKASQQRTALQIVRGRLGRLRDAIGRRRELRRIARDPRRAVLLFTNDLSRSGAPLLVFEMARLLVAEGQVPLVISPRDGPVAAQLRAEGARVIVDVSIRSVPAWLIRLIDRTRYVICNTVDTAEMCAAAAQRRPTLWYLHEVSLLDARLARPEVRAAIDAVTLLWAGSRLCADKLRDLRPSVSVVPYGLAPLGEPPQQPAKAPLRIGIFASIERRKGQDLAIAGMALLSAQERARIALTLYGRVLEPDFARPVLAQAEALGIHYAGELDMAAYRAAMAGSDAVLVSSRDDTLPLVSIDALGLGRLLLLSPHVGTAAWLEPGVSVLIAPEASAEGFAALFRKALDRMVAAPVIGAAARQAFDRHFSSEAFRRRLHEGCAALEGAA